MILARPEWDWFIFTMCRGNDVDRAHKFWRVLDHLNALGNMADLNDDPEQKPLELPIIEKTILSYLPTTDFDIVITHSPWGEYTRHLRHEELARAVVGLWQTEQIRAKAVLMFAYEDGQRNYYPQADKDAHIKEPLPNKRWEQKYRLVTDVYGFSEDSWEARTTPREEAFWYFESPDEINSWMSLKGMTQ
ncbi:MAG: PIG-L family deacetylase [Planctomycetota bacterium]|nr:MAG: PIG-L family deacetylase [Planctomycetota bacterium]